jgi:hypothetical protein
VKVGGAHLARFNHERAPHGRIELFGTLAVEDAAPDPNNAIFSVDGSEYVGAYNCFTVDRDEFVSAGLDEVDDIGIEFNDGTAICVALDYPDPEPGDVTSPRGG